MIISGYTLTDLYDTKHKSEDNNDDTLKILFITFITICVLASQVLFTLPGSIKVDKLLTERKEIQERFCIKKLNFLL